MSVGKYLVEGFESRKLFRRSSWSRFVVGGRRIERWKEEGLFVFRRVEQVLPYCRFNNSTGYMGMVEDNSDNRVGFTIMETERELRLPRDHGRMLTALPNLDSGECR